MNDLQQLWHRQEATREELEQFTLRPLASPDGKSAFDLLATEERRTKKYLPLTYLFVTLMMFGFGVFLHTSGTLQGWMGWLGYVLLVLSGICVSYFSQVVRIPYDQFAYDWPTQTFLNDVQEAIHRKLLMGTVGIVLQAVTLTAGIGLIIFSHNPDVDPGGTFGWLLGSMGAISALMAGVLHTILRWHYKPVLQTVEAFFNDEGTLDLV